MVDAGEYRTSHSKARKLTGSLSRFSHDSSKSGDRVFDPFLGSGTLAVVARKLNRKFCGVEINEEYCLWAAKRLLQADMDKTIQGYADGVFWERNSFAEQKRANKAEE